VLQVRAQEHTSRRKKNSKHARFDRMRLWFDRSRHGFCRF